MPFVLPRSCGGRKEPCEVTREGQRWRMREREKKRGRVGELTAVFASLSHGAVDRLLFHFVTREYFRRYPDPSDIDSVTSLFSDDVEEARFICEQ